MLKTRKPRRTTCRKLAFKRHDHQNVRPLSSLGTQSHAKKRRSHEQFKGSAHDALAQTDAGDYENLVRGVSS